MLLRFGVFSVFGSLICLLHALPVHAAPHMEIDLRTMSDPAGDHSISLCARTSPTGNVPGHAFVVYSIKPPGKDRRILSLGFTTSSGPAKAVLSYKGWLTTADGYLGEERYTSINEECLVVHIDKSVFDQAWNLAYPLASIPGLADLRLTAAYTLSANDCMTFMSNVASALKGVKVPFRGETELPLAYVRRLIDAN
jgi:hypothetical protein